MDIENLQRLDVRIVRGLDEHGAFVSPDAGDGFVPNQGPCTAIQVSCRFVRSSLINIGGEEPSRRRLAANTASRTFRVVNFTITGGASVELMDFFRRCAIEKSWVAFEMFSLFWQKS